MKAIEADKLCKEFDVSKILGKSSKISAVREVSFVCEEGEAVAFIGRNGSGKSTVIKMLVGVLFPSSGAARILGLDVQKHRQTIAHRIGTVFGQKSQLWFHLPSRDSFLQIGSVYNLPYNEIVQRQKSLCRQLGVEDVLDIPVRKLSLGLRLRMEIVASLLHRPRVLFLDEPTIGLDILAKKQLRRMIMGLCAKEGVTVFLTSHDFVDVESVCRRVLFMQRGNLIADMPMQEILAMSAAYKHIRVTYGKISSLSLDKMKHTFVSDGVINIEIDTKKEDFHAVLSKLVNAGPVLDMTINNKPISSIIQAIFESSNKGEVDALFSSRG